MLFLDKNPNFGMGLAFCFFSFLIPVCAYPQIGGDPSTLPIPQIEVPRSGRAVVISVVFNSQSDVSFEGVQISNVQPRSAIGAPPLLRIELCDSNGDVYAEQNAWHPLLSFNWDESNQESALMEESGEGTFYVPLSAELACVRIFDISSGAQLLEADVAQEVYDYCLANQTISACSGFSPNPTPTATIAPSPTPTATIAPSPTSTATVAPSPTPTATVVPSPTPTATVVPSPTPTATVVPSPTPTATVAPSPKPTATVVPSPTPTATSGRVFICHLRGRRAPKTIQISESAMAAHVRHGDLMGPCESNLGRSLLRGFKRKLRRKSRKRSS